MPPDPPPTATERLCAVPEPYDPGWRSRVGFIPPVAVFLAWALSHQIYDRTVPCLGMSRERCVSTLEALHLEITGLGVDSAIVEAYDVAARFTWQSTLVLFLVVAALASVAAAYLVWQSLRSCSIYPPVWSIAAFAVMALGVFVYILFRPDTFLILDDLLVPLVQRVLVAGADVQNLIERTQRLFRAAAFTSSALVVIAAGAALLPPKPARSTRVKDHLVDQWRRLTHALYAGAALLVSALVFQVAFFGWARTLTEATAAEMEKQRIVAMANLNRLQSYQDRVGAPFVTMRARMSAAEARLKAASTGLDSAAAREEIRTLRARYRAAGDAFLADSLLHSAQVLQVARDTARARVNASRAAAVATRVALITDAAIAKAGGLVYSTLLLVMYLPAALILLERARGLSLLVADTEKERQAWRVDNGIAFSFTTQWVKALAVLSPALASIPAAQFLLKLFE